MTQFVFHVLSIKDREGPWFVDYIVLDVNACTCFQISRPRTPDTDICFPFLCLKDICNSSIACIDIVRLHLYNVRARRRPQDLHSLLQPTLARRQGVFFLKRYNAGALVCRQAETERLLTFLNLSGC